MSEVATTQQRQNVQQPLERKPDLEGEKKDDDDDEELTETTTTTTTSTTTTTTRTTSESMKLIIDKATMQSLTVVACQLDLVRIIVTASGILGKDFPPLPEIGAVYECSVSDALAKGLGMTGEELPRSFFVSPYRMDPWSGIIEYLLVDASNLQGGRHADNLLQFYAKFPSLEKVGQTENVKCEISKRTNDTPPVYGNKTTYK